MGAGLGAVAADQARVAIDGHDVAALAADGSCQGTDPDASDVRFGAGFGAVGAGVARGACDGLDVAALIGGQAIRTGDRT